MSQSAAKASRRSIRKALGPKTVDTVVSLAAGLENHADILTLHDSKLDHLRKMIHASDDALQAVAVEACCARAVTDRKSLGARLRWLLTGK